MTTKLFYRLWNDLHGVPRDHRCQRCERTGVQGGNLKDVEVPVPRILREAGWDSRLYGKVTEKLCGICHKRDYERFKKDKIEFTVGVAPEPAIPAERIKEKLDDSPSVQAMREVLEDMNRANLINLYPDLENVLTGREGADNAETKYRIDYKNGKSKPYSKENIAEAMASGEVFSVIEPNYNTESYAVDWDRDRYSNPIGSLSFTIETGERFAYNEDSLRKAMAAGHQITYEGF